MKRVIIESVNLVESTLPFGSEAVENPLIEVEVVDFEEQLMNDWRDYKDFVKESFVITVNPLKQKELVPIIRCIKGLNTDAKNVRDNLNLIVGQEFNIYWDVQFRAWRLGNWVK